MENSEKRSLEVLTAQKQILAHITKGSPLQDTLKSIAKMVETFSPGCRAALYFVADGKLVLGAAPSFSNAFTDVVHGCPVGVNRGVCGHAGATGERTVSTNVAVDPIWGPFAEWLLSFGIKAALSMPVMRDGIVIATVSLYYNSIYEPTEWDFEIAEIAVNLMSIASERSKQEELIVEQSLKLVSSTKLASIGEKATSIALEINHPLSVIQNHASFLKLLADRTELSSVAVLNSAGEIEKTVSKVVSIVKDLKTFKS